MLSHSSPNASMYPNPYTTVMYGARLCVHYEQPDSPLKPTLTIQMADSDADTFSSLLTQCGFFWHATRLEEDAHITAFQARTQRYLSFKLTGHRKVEEALKCLLNDAPPYTYRNTQTNRLVSLPPFDFFDTRTIFSVLRSNILQAITEKNALKQKKSLLASMDIDALSIIQNIPIKPGVSKITISHPNANGQLMNTTYFKKINNGPLGAIEAFTNEMFLTLVGEEYGSRMDLLFDSLGSRVGMMSPEIEGFQTLTFIISQKFDLSKMTAEFTSLSQKLIRKGYGKIEAFNYLFAEADANCGNTGFDGGDHLRRIDCGQALWTITCFGHTPEDKEYQPFAWLEACCPKDAFPINEEDIINLPVLKHAKPHNALYQYFMRNNVIHLMHQMAKNLIFENDKWYIFFKYLLLDKEIYQARLDGYISSIYWKEKILTYLIERKATVEKVLFNIPQFQFYMANSGVQSLEKIIGDFQKLNAGYNDRYASFRVNIDNININGEQLLLKIGSTTSLSSTLKTKKTPCPSANTSSKTTSMTLFSSSVANTNNDSEQVHIQQGDDYQAKSKLKEALSEYNKALALNRMNLEVYCKRGYIYYLQGKIDEAIDEFDKVINEDARFSLAYIHRARAHYLKQNRSAALCDYLIYIDSLNQSIQKSEIIDELQNVVLRHQDTIEDDIALFSDENKTYIRHCLTSISRSRLTHFSASPFKSAFSTESKINSNVSSHAINRL